MKTKVLILSLLLSMELVSHAQTYHHDATVMNQFTTQETGVGALTPDLYYKAFHNKYYNSARSMNKNLSRLATSAAAFSQVEMADSIRSYLESRAKVEALNMADRKYDIAYLTEESKLDKSLKTFRDNLGVLNRFNVSSDEKDSWSDLLSSYEYAIWITHHSYMPNSKRQRQYVALRNLMRENNQLLVKRISYLKAKAKLSLFSDVLLHNKASIQSAADSSYDRWKGSWKGSVTP